MGHANGKYHLDEKDVEWLKQNTQLSENEVRTRYDHFVKNYPNGKIPKEEFKNMLQGAFNASHRMSKINAQGYEDYIFNTFDMDGDGSIDFKEFLWVMYALSDDTPKQKLELIFHTFDNNRDGTISNSEIKTVVKDFFKLLSKLKDTSEFDYSFDISYKPFNFKIPNIKHLLIPRQSRNDQFE